MKRVVMVALMALGAVVAVVVQLAAQRQTLPTIEVYKSPTCGCCSKWVDHLKTAGFTVRTTDSDAVEALKDKHGIPANVRSCHTALAGGYVIEGHVPVADVQRLLKEKPAIAGIGVPGMPIGSPGMEVAGTKAQPYDVIGFSKNGATRIFASHNK